MRITVFEYERGLEYIKGRFRRELPPGQYWVTPIFGSRVIRKVDVRSQYVSVPGQEILTADGLSLKVSLSVVYEVVSPEIAINKVAAYSTALYKTVQDGLREVVSEVTMEELLMNRNILSRQILERTTPAVAPLGLRLTQVSIKDLMLPGKLRDLYTKVAQAKQEGIAQLERARGETAALRNLANAARMINDNPNLLKLRWLQALERSTGNSFVVSTNPSVEERKTTA
ncbi:SPFH domain / Band 7 family, putative [Synechococcus sp. PCC 7335]|uniref:slipin family protein n=1 Tax=Synechococcus sp. (strain ATCC 29403 / PCC 7335) TaxID=91464 RepID=UPI00017EE455|nr:slipin family protein [Synechococcus sp. PCC 7335]EDX85489.1 SPFH domain / Band 7 family, putative [Synechococcus sp. PCC 7335]